MITIVCPRDIGPGVANSQVIELAVNLSNAGDNEIQLSIPEKNRGKVNLKNFKGKVVWYEGGKALAKSCNESTLIYIRSVLDFHILFFNRLFYRKKYKILYSFRGLVHEESFFRNGSSIRKLVLFLMEKRAFKGADFLNTVSKRMEKALRDKFGSKPIKVIPCCITESKKKSYSYSQQMNFVYVGSLSKWQCFREVLSLFCKISKRFPEARLQLITLEIDKAKTVLLEDEYKEIKDLVSAKSLPQKEVLKDLGNYDFGFLLREDNIINQTASPIKFLEYVSQGVIPIMSNNIGDYSEDVRKYKLGITLDDNSQIEPAVLETYSKDELIHERLYNYSQEFLWKKHIEKYNYDV